LFTGYLCCSSYLCVYCIQYVNQFVPLLNRDQQPIENKQFSSGFNSNNGVNDGVHPKFNFPKIEINKFDGTKVFTLVNQIEQYFELCNTMDDKKIIHMTTLNFEIKLYQWYQWVVKRNPLFIIILGVCLQET
jgi:hypothetical protein